ERISFAAGASMMVGAPAPGNPGSIGELKLRKSTITPQGLNHFAQENATVAGAVVIRNTPIFHVARRLVEGPRRSIAVAPGSFAHDALAATGAHLAFQRRL